MEHYTPRLAAEVQDVPGLLKYVVDEFRRISVSFAGVLPQELVELHAAPMRLRDYMIVAADGTDWNPGSGQGVYVYYASAWHKLG